MSVVRNRANHRLHGSEGPNLEIIHHSCMTQGCKIKVKSKVWPGDKAPRKRCWKCQERVADVSSFEEECYEPHQIT